METVQPPIPSTKFTPLQHLMLKLFARNAPEEELLAIKDLVAKYYLDKLQKQISESAWFSGCRTKEEFDSILNNLTSNVTFAGQ